VVGVVRLILSVHSAFSAQFEGDANRIAPGRRHIVTVSFTPRREGHCEVALELKFRDHKRKEDFVIRRTLSGWARRPTNEQERHQIGSSRALQSWPINGSGGDHSSLPADDEEEDGEELLDTGISVSDEEGLNVGIVERRHPDGPFATATFSLTIKLADGFPDVTFLEEKIRTSDGSDSSCVKTPFKTFLVFNRCRSFVAAFEGDSRTIRPGTESTVRVIFSPKFEGLFEAELKLVFYDVRLLSRFVVRRRLQGIAGSIEGNNLSESSDQENVEGPLKDDRYAPPETVVALLQPDGRRRSRKLPEYDVPPIVQEAVNSSTAVHPYDRKAGRLVSTLRPKSLTEDTYAQYFQALLNVEDGQQQCVP
jgi:hypothetical protein